jgi:hypothetical protein
MEDFDDDFVDASDSPAPSADEEEASAPAEEEDAADPGVADDDRILPAEVSDVFAAAGKLSTLNLSLSRSREVANTATNQLYSLAFCVFQDCDLLLAKHRAAVPFSVHEHVARHPPARCEGGVVAHPAFPDGVNLARVDGRGAAALAAFLALRCDVCQRGLAPVVQCACGLLRDPLVRSHNALRALKQRISDLRKSNTELSVQTRQTANRLVRISKAAREAEVEPSADRSDVIVHQQKLQKALTRVCNLREANDAAAAANAEWQARAAEQGGRPVGAGRKVAPQVEAIQKRIAEVTASNEQSEEERETELAQRRVSLSRMNAAIQKAGEEREKLRFRIADVENRLRIMTQGQKAGEPPKGAPAARKVVGSRIPVHHPERVPDV